ncbi:hypothetical protein ACFX2I_031797 [Malus domestica]
MKPAFKRSNSQTLDSNLGTNASSSLRRKSTTCSQFQKAHRFRLFVLRFVKKLEMGGSRFEAHCLFSQASAFP